MADEPRLAFEFICPESHTVMVSFRRDELQHMLSKPFGHGIWCHVCQREYQPPAEWLEKARKAL